MNTISDKVASLGHSLPKAPGPVANYVASALSGGQLWVSGQIALSDERKVVTGRLGADASVEQGYAAARGAALNVIGHVAAALGDDLDRVKRVIKLVVYVAATPEFTQHPQVANGASDLMVAVFGDAGRHARAAVGVASLPVGAVVEVEAVFQVAE